MFIVTRAPLHFCDEILSSMANAEDNFYSGVGSYSLRTRLSIDSFDSVQLLSSCEAVLYHNSKIKAKQ